jgi:hypothetical protein
MAQSACVPTGNDIARSVLATYSRLPQKCKPLEREPGIREWVPLSGMVLAKNWSGSVCNEAEATAELECVALG